MKKNYLRLLIFTLAFIILQSCTNKNNFKQEFDKFSWMTGMWADSVSGFYESWTILNDSLLSGKGYQVAAGDTIFGEKISLTKCNGQWIYIVNFMENETRFILQNKPGDSLVFENSDNEFPQRITYVKKTNRFFIAFIENPGDSERIIHFNFLRIR